MSKKKVVGIRLRWDPKPYDFKYEDINLNIGDNVVIETDFGTKIGRIIYTDKEIEKKDIESVSGDVVKKVDEDDLKQLEKLEELSHKTMETFKEKIDKHKLNIKPIVVEYSLDESKIIFYFTSESRVDFRSLLKDLIRTFKKKIKLQQVGPRDEARALGGYGECGRPLCCRNFLGDLESITMEMAREQNIEGKGSNKISGLCGRLMCCLAFEIKQKQGNKGGKFNKPKKEN